MLLLERLEGAGQRESQGIIRRKSDPQHRRCWFRNLVRIRLWNNVLESSRTLRQMSGGKNKNNTSPPDYLFCLAVIKSRRAEENKPGK